MNITTLCFLSKGYWGANPSRPWIEMHNISMLEVMQVNGMKAREERRQKSW